MAKKKKFGALLEKQTKQLPVVQQKAPKTISINASTGGIKNAVSSVKPQIVKTARQKAEEERSTRMRQGLSKTFSTVVRSSFNQKMSQPTRMKKGMFQSLGNVLQPVKQNASETASKRSTSAPLGQIKSSILEPIKQDIRENPYDAVRKVGMKGSRNERKVYVPLWQRDENGQISSNQRRLENAARGGNRKAQVEAEMGRTKAQTRSGHTYDQYINAELNKKGLLGQDYILRSKDPSKEAMDYRQRYGFDKEALDRVLAIANNTPASGDYAERFNGQDNGNVLDRLKFGFDESYRARNIEDTLRRQYGVELSDEDQAKLDAVRDSGGYMVGNMLGQASQFALTAPLSGAVEGKLLSKVGLEGGRAAIKTTGDALKYAGARIGADQIVSAPVNILDALKADNGEEFVKRLGLNTAMDIFFGGLTEIPGLRKNIHFVRGLEMNNAANATSDASQKLVAKIGAQRELRQAVEEAGDAARLEAIQNANGISASTMNGADALDMVDDNALRSIENMGYGSDVAREADIPNVSAPAENAPRRYTPQNAEQSARIQNALNTIDQYGGLDRMLRTADDTDRLIRTFQDPAFNDVDMLEGVANNLFPEGKMRSIRIDAERAYSNDVRAFDADPESFDFIQPVREDYYIDLLSKEVVDELQRSRNVRDIIPQLADDLGVSEEELLDALRRTEGEFYGYAPSEGVRNARTVVENAPAQNFDAIADARDVYQNAVKYYDDLIADLEARGDISNETLQWLRARRNATDKARLKAGKNLKSADEYVDRFAKDIDYVRDRIYKTDGYDIFERHSVGKANEEIRNALSEMNERLTPINGRRQPAQMVTKESANVVPNERTVRRPNRQIKEGDVSSSLLRNLGYDGVDEVAGAADNAARAIPVENGARRAAEQSAKNESVEDATERLIRKWGNTGNETSYRNVVKQYEGMSAAELKNEKEALQRMANTSSIDPEEAADRIAVIDAIIREKNGASVKAPSAESSTANVDRSKEAWDDIPNITDGEQEPKDLMRQKPHRNENQIPKHSEQKVKEQVFYRGDGIGNKNARETAEQTAQGAAQQEPKRAQVNGTANKERPKTDYSEMSLHDLQAERHSLEEQARYDKTGRVDNKIYEIDEEFKRRGEEPNWFAVEPEEGGKRVRSPREQDAEVERLKKKYGEFKNGLNKKIETDEGVRRNLKTLDTILPEASPEVDHIVTNNMLDGKYAIDDGRTTKDILTEVKANMAENPEAYTNKIVNFDETVDARERIVALETAQAYWKEVGNTEYELKATEALSKYVSESASILKIHGILRKLSKPARMDYLDQTIAKLEKRFEKRLKRAKIEHIRVSDETRKMLKEAKTDEQTKEAWTRASLEIWNQIPASVKEKMDFIRVNAMLLNPKTHIRNFFGNALFLPLREMKNITGTGLEYLAMKAGILDPSNRTKAIIPYKEGMDYGGEILKDMGDELRGANRYFEDIANDRPFDVDVFMAGRQNGNPFINGIRKATDKIGNFNAWALEHEDFAFFNGAFKEHFGRVMKARKLTVKDLENNPALRNDIIEIATDEALRATYRDESAAARIISRWKNPGEKAHITRKIIGVALDAILPFTKTPINILRRAVDYSPLGFPKGAYNFLSGWHSGDQKQVVKGLDQLASAIPGSGLAILGWFMAERDGVTGNLGAEKDDQFMRDLGKQKFSIVFHSGTDKEWSYTLDWAAPGCIPFFTGVAYKEWSDGSFDFWEVADTFEKMFEPTMEMSVMQGIKNTAETFQRASDGGVWQGLFSVGVNTGLQYVGQFKPTLVSQTARFIDPVRRDTTSTADTALQRQVERWWNKQKAGIPSTPLTNNSLYNISSKSLNPYQNVWGDEENNTYNDGVVMRAIENFLSPGYAKKYKADDVDKEILSIYKQDPSAEGVIPTKFSKYEIGFDGGTVRFSNDDRANFIKVQGKVSKQDLRKIFDSEEYNNASLTNKQKMIANAYADAKGEAKRDTLLKMGKDEWKVYTDDFDDDSRKKDYSDAKDAGLKADQYYELMTTKDWDLDESGKPVKSELAMYLNDQDLTDAQRAVIFSKLANSNTKNPYEDGTAHTTDWQSEYDNYLAKKNKGSSGSSGSKKRRSGRSGSSGGGSKKARAKTDSEKRFAALQTGKAPTNAKGIEALSSVKGLSKSQKKALVKLLKKRLEV